MEQKSSITALMSAFARAYHTQNEENPVFDDYLAKDLLSDDEYAAAAKYVLDGAQFFEPDLTISEENTQDVMRYLVNVHLAPSPLCRAAYSEKILANAISTGTTQYVILGAGLDTFAWRNKNFSDKYAVFELDHPLTQADKLSRVKRAGWQMPTKLKFVPLNFNTDSLSEALFQAGFSKTKKAFFSWLGVTYYLTKEEIEKTVAEFAALCAYGSTLVFDYPDEGFFTAPEKRVWSFSFS